jgi:two-component system, NarL family, sensor histidine kinase DesK
MGQRSHYLIYLFLLALAGPASAVFQGDAHPAWLAALALGVFVTCFVVVVEVANRQIRDARADLRFATFSTSRAVLVVLMAVIAVLATVGFGAQWIVLFVFVVTTGTMTAPIRRAHLVIVAVAAAMIASEVAGGWNFTSAATAASWALSIVMAGYITLLLRRRGLLISELRQTQSEVARLAAADAVADERLRFARDLHDLLGHSLSLIVLKAELARRLLERGDAGEQARREVADLEDAARRALVEVREAVAGYRARSFSAELDRGCDALASAGIEVTVNGAPGRADETAPLPPEVDEVLAWVVREATTNVLRHSGARHARIDVRSGDGKATLEVTDDGPDAKDWDWLAAARSGSSGLLGLQERVAAVGGRFAAGPAAGGGFRVSAVLPLDEAASR